MAEIAVKEIAFPCLHEILQAGGFADINLYRSHANLAVPINIQERRMTQLSVLIGLSLAFKAINMQAICIGFPEHGRDIKLP